MNLSDRIMILLRMCGMKQIDLLEPLGMSSKQSLSNKFSGCRWSAEDLATIAAATGTELCFLLPSGEKVTIR